MTPHEKRIIDWIRTGSSCDYYWLMSDKLPEGTDRTEENILKYRVCRTHALPIQCRHADIRIFHLMFLQLQAVHGCLESKLCDECKIYKELLEKEWYAYFQTVGPAI